MNRAYSLLTIKSVDEEKRIISGIASTPSIDRVGDVVDPMGARFALPMPLLLDHNSTQQVGHVEFAKPNKTGIPFKASIPRIAAPGMAKDLVDYAWDLVKAGLRSFVSIGFKPIDYEITKDGGYNFKVWDWFELSLCTIPANSDAVLTPGKSLESAFLAFKSLDEAQRKSLWHIDPSTFDANFSDLQKRIGDLEDTQQRAATGQTLQRVVRLDPPGASGISKTPKAPEGKMSTTAEMITGLETKRAAHKGRLDAIQNKAAEESRTKDEAERQEFSDLKSQIDSIDEELKDLRDMEAIAARTAKPVIKADDVLRGDTRPRIEVKVQPKLEPGIGYTRLVKVKMAAKLTGESPLVMAQRMYGPDSEVVGIITKANEVVAGTTISGNWAADLVSAEGAAVAFFLEFLRPETILGKFGVGGVPNLTRIDFYTPYVIETGGGDAYWVGEGKPKPLTSFDYDRSTLTPLKIANIAVLTEENIRYSTPNSDMVVRNALVKAIAKGLDVAFIDPANSGTSNVKPASVTNGAETIVSTGDDADDIRVDVRALFRKFILANNAPKSGVWIMSAENALALSMMVNALGQPEFSGISMSGGAFQGLPVIVSQHIGDVVALVNAEQILLGDEGGVAVDMSREASIEMRSSGLGMDATAGTATAGSVSMFQTNSVALRAERAINWKRGRDSAVAYLTSVDWGGAVPTV